MKKIYSIVQIGVAAFLGGPIAAAILLAQNFKEFGTPSKSLQSWIFCVVILLVFAITGILFPKIPLSFTLLQFLLVVSMARNYQGKEIKHHQDHEGAIKSWWPVIGYALLGLVISLVIAIGIVLIQDLLPPPAV